MQAIRILQTGDLHLETPFTGCSLSPTQARQRRGELRETFDRIIGLVQEQGIQLLLIAGDLFEHKYANKETMRFLSRKFAEIPATRVFIAAGNHDPAMPESYYQTFPWGDNVHIFCQQSFETVTIPELNCCVHGLGWTRWENREALLEKLNLSDRDRLNIVLLHGDTTGDESIYLPVSNENMRDCRADYIALGHIHSYTRFESGGRIIGQYAGSPEPLNFGETGEHGVLIGEVGKANASWRFVPLARRQYLHLSVPVTANSDTEAVASLCQSLVLANGTHHLYRLTLTGMVDPEAPLDLTRLAELVREACYHAEVVDQTRAAYDLEEIAASQGNSVLGKFVVRMLELMDSRTGEEREVARRALYHGLNALTRKKVG